MGSVRLGFCSGAVVAAALTPAACPVAFAAGGAGGISVTPPSPVPGGEIQLRAQECQGRTGTASSEAFVADAVLTGRGAGLVGETRVRSSLRPGAYGVQVTCYGVENRIRTTLTVAGQQGERKPPGVPAPPGTRTPGSSSAPAPPGTRTPGSSSAPAPPATRTPAAPGAPAAPATRTPASARTPESSPVAHASPVAPVRAGGGGDARAVAAESRDPHARDEGPGTRQAVVGLLLAGVAGLVVVLRGSRGGRGTR